MMTTTIAMKPITTPPTRDPYAGEQNFLTYNDETAAWDIVHLEFGDPLDIASFAVGVTHWMDLAQVEPDDIEVRRHLRQSLWEEERATVFQAE